MVRVTRVKGLIREFKSSFSLPFAFGLLSLGGLPPFLGFIPKWSVILILREIGGYMLAVFLSTFTLIALYFYVRLVWGYMGLTGAKKPNYSGDVGLGRGV